MNRPAVTLGLVAVFASAAAIAPTLTRPEPVAAPEPAPSGARPPAARRDTAVVRTALDGPLSTAGGGRFLIIEIESDRWGAAQDIAVDVAFAPTVRAARAACAGDAPCSSFEDGRVVVHSSRMGVHHGDRRTFGLWLEAGPNPRGTLDVADVTVRYTDQRGRPMIARQVVSADVVAPYYAAAGQRPDIARSAVMALAIDELYLSGWAVESSPGEARRHAEAARVWVDAIDEALPADASIRELQRVTWAWRTDLPGLVAPATARISELNAAIGAN